MRDYIKKVIHLLLRPLLCAIIRLMSKPKKATKLQKIDPKHDLFSALYFSPRLNGKPNSFFGNAYKSAIEAGFSEATATNIVSATQDKLWVREAYNKMVNFKPEHTIKQLEDIAMSPDEYTRDRLKALEMLGKIQGIFIDRVQSEVQVTFTNSVPRPTVEATVLNKATPSLVTS